MKTIQLDYNDLFIASLFTIVGNSVVIKASNGDVLYTLPTGLGITTEESDVSTITFSSGNYYFVIAGFPSTVQRDLDNDILIAACNIGSSGAGGATAANQVLEIAELEAITLNTETRGALTTVLAAVTTTSAIVLAANANRKSLLIWNNSGGVIRIGIGTPALAASGLRIPANNGFSFDYVPVENIHIRTEASTNNVNLIWS